jgi:hypothetical protein
MAIGDPQRCPYAGFSVWKYRQAQIDAEELLRIKRTGEALVRRSTLRNAAAQGHRTKTRSSNREHENPSWMRFSSKTYGSS